MSVRAYAKSTISYGTWVASTAYALNDEVVAPTDTYYCYKCTTASGETPTSGSFEPVWPVVVDETVADGDLVWTCKEKEASPSALSAELDTEGQGGYPYKEMWVKSDANPCEFIVYGSHDGVNWRQIDEMEVPQGDRDNRHKGLQNAYRFIRVSTETVASNEIEIIAGV